MKVSAVCCCSPGCGFKSRVFRRDVWNRVLNVPPWCTGLKIRDDARGENCECAEKIRAALAKPIPQPEPLGPITKQAATERTNEPVETKHAKAKAFNTGAASTCVGSLSALLPIVRSTSRVLSSKDFVEEATESRLCRCLDALSELSCPYNPGALILMASRVFNSKSLNSSHIHRTYDGVVAPP